MAQAHDPPDLNIPDAKSTVKVSIIDTTSHMSGFPMAGFVDPLMPGLSEMDCGSYAFLIQRAKSGSKYDTLLFDLGVRRDWENCPPTFVAGIKEAGFSIDVEKDTADILRENGQDLADIGGIIWSHWHFDHTGNPALFPPTTDLIVGPGFKSDLLPAYPTVPDSHIDEGLWKGRDLREIDFVKEGGGLKIGRFAALDFYGDGSFYLLDAPGHTIGHMSALARTTADPPTFIFMGGDIAHHAGEFRPTEYIPLPERISSSYAGATQARLLPLPTCPGEVFLALHPKKSRTEPFFNPTLLEHGWHNDGEEATRSIEKMTEFDAYENIFPVIAHDNSLPGVIDFYPKLANDWQAKGWKEESFWGFLTSFDYSN